MNYKEFCEWMSARLKEYYEDGARIEIQSIRKNNGVMQEGLLIVRKGCNITPTIYIKEFYTMYENGMDPEEILKNVVAIYEDNKAEASLDFQFFMEFNNVKGMIAYKLINREENGALLEEVPWISVLDLALVFYCILPEHIFSNGTILIKNSHCKQWGVDAADLLGIARENTPLLCPLLLLDMKTMLGIWEAMEKEKSKEVWECMLKRLWSPVDLEKLEISDRRREERMFLLTNKMRNQGAVAIFYKGVLKRLSEKLESDLFILPSSIHECIVLPMGEEAVKEELENLVRKVNRTQVMEEERLSDRIYRYLRNEDQII